MSSKGELAVLYEAGYLGHRLFDGTLARMPLVGGAPREVAEHVREADWAPDGERLAIIRNVDGHDRLEFPNGTVVDQAVGYLSDPRVSPTGDRIAFFEHPTNDDDREASPSSIWQGRRRPSPTASPGSKAWHGSPGVANCSLAPPATRCYRSTASCREARPVLR